MPEILQRVNEYKKRGVTAIGLLKAIAASNNKAVYIIEQAIALQAIRKARKENVETKINVERPRQEGEKLIRQRRISAGGRKLKETTNAMQGIVPAAKLTQEQMDAKIESLSPVADERDVLPDIELDPALAECLQVDAYLIRQRSFTINKDSSAGTTAWTPVLLAAILNQKNSPGYTAETPPYAVHEAIARFK